MPKRFIDTELWTRPWYQDLPPVEKLAFRYLLDSCDNVGVWKPNYKLAEFQIGAAVDWEALRLAANGNIEVLENGKWWLVDFCAFQYGQLRESCTPRRSYFKLLAKHGLLERVPSTLKDKDKDKELDKDKEKDKDKETEPAVKRLVDTYFDTYVARTKEKPTVTGRWGRAFKTWLRCHTEDDIRRVIAYFFAYDKRTLFGFDKFQTAFDNLAPAALGHKPRAGPAGEGWECPHCGERNRHTGSRCLRCKEDRDDPVEEEA